MIEILLQAERALSMGLVDQAERLYRQAADADPHNSIAVVGLARVALERGDEPEAWRQARRALVIDPENVAAQRLADRLEEVWAYRGESLPDAATVAEADTTVSAVAVADTTATAVEVADRPEPGEVTVVADTTAPAAPVVVAGTTSGFATPDPTPRPERSALDRLLRRNRP